MTMQPYYDQDGITIYHGDCRDILPYIAPESVGLVLTDPPYGVKERTRRASNGRGSVPGKTSSTLQGASRAVLPSRDLPEVYGDDEPFDPAPLLRFPRLILWGANHYAEKLPASPSWIVWDKLDGLSTDKRMIGLDDNADLEMAWSNLGGPARLIPHRWKGLVRRSERGERVLHPTQKRVAIMALLLEWRTKPGDLVLDPYMGSGPIAKACQMTGRRYIGVEVHEPYVVIAVRRLQQAVLPLAMTGGE